MTDRTMFGINVEASAKKHGFSFQEQDGIIMSSRNSAGDDEPDPSIIQAGRTLAAELIETHPLLKEHKAISMEFVDEWVDLTIEPGKIFPTTQKEKS